MYIDSLRATTARYLYPNAPALGLAGSCSLLRLDRRLSALRARLRALSLRRNQMKATMKTRRKMVPKKTMVMVLRSKKLGT